jgi:MoxR-like ATPase
MPADIVGSMMLESDDRGGKSLRFQPGPIFANLVLADEINRATPKTQSALLEAMQEKTVTSGTTTHELERPFMVMATQNPIEMEGTYPLPEAQLDRFMFNVVIDYLPEDDEVQVVKQTTSRGAEPINAIFHGEDVIRFHEVVRRVPIAEDIVRMAVRIAAASRPKQKSSADFVNQFVSWGEGTRAGQYLVLGAKARALLQGRAHVTEEDIRVLALPVLRHRILVNYRAEAEGVSVDNIVERLLNTRS